MSLKSCLLVSCVALAFGTTSASAGLVPVTSYDMNNGNGATQFTGGNNYFDFSYTNSTTHTVDPNASKNGSNQAVPNNAAPKDAPLSGGTRNSDRRHHRDAGLLAGHQQHRHDRKRPVRRTADPVCRLEVPGPHDHFSI